MAQTKSIAAAYAYFCAHRGDCDEWAEAITAAWKAGQSVTPKLTRQQVEDAALAQDWQADYAVLSSKGLEMLADEPEIRIEEQLRTLLGQEVKAREILQAATRAMQKKEHAPTQDETNRYRIAQDKWLQITDAITEKTEALRVQELEARNAPAWREQYNQLVKKLGEQYQGLGPQYELLIERLSAVTIRLRQMEHSGRDIRSQEYKHWHDMHLNYVKRLQEHTESRTMRLENVDTQLRLLLQVVLEGLSRQIVPFAPEAWATALRGVPQIIEAKKVELLAG